MTAETSDIIDELTDGDVMRWAESRGLGVTFTRPGEIVFTVAPNEAVVVYAPGDSTATYFTDERLPWPGHWNQLQRALAQTRLRAIADHVGKTQEEADHAS